MDWTGYGYGLIWISLFYYYHYHHRYHYSYHNFIITILCYAPSVITCTVGGAIQMTVYIYIYPVPTTGYPVPKRGISQLTSGCH